MQKMNDLVSREAVIDAIRYRVCQGQGNKEHICKRGSCAYCGIMEIMSDISCIPRSSNWRNVKDELPKYSSIVLVMGYDYDYIVVPAIYCSKTNGWYFYSEFNALLITGNEPIESERINVDILAWQPLPEAPKEEIVIK